MIDAKATVSDAVSEFITYLGLFSADAKDMDFPTTLLTPLAKLQKQATNLQTKISKDNKGTLVVNTLSPKFWNSFSKGKWWQDATFLQSESKFKELILILSSLMKELKELIK